MPKLGSGTGGAGGIKDGGWVWVWGGPRCIPSNVAAGMEGKAAAMGDVSAAKAVSTSSAGAPISESAPPA
jgi:hypothetical protein